MKKSVAFDERVAREAAALAGPGGFSSLVNGIVAQRLQAIRITKLLDEMEAEFGPIPEEVQRQVDAEVEALLCEVDAEPS